MNRTPKIFAFNLPVPQFLINLSRLEKAKKFYVHESVIFLCLCACQGSIANRVLFEEQDGEKNNCSSRVSDEFKLNNSVTVKDKMEK